MADEDFISVDVALQVVETIASRLHVGDSDTLHFLRQDGEQSMNVRPLHDRIIVHRLEEAEQQIGGIIIPDTAKEKPQQGTVIAVGNGKVNDDGKRIRLDVKAGDRILFGKYSGQEIKLDGQEYLIMKEDDVLAVLEDKPKTKPAVIKGQTKKKTKTTTKSKKQLRRPLAEQDSEPRRMGPGLGRSTSHLPLRGAPGRPLPIRTVREFSD